MGKQPSCNTGDARDERSIPGSVRSPGGGHGNPHQYFCLENSIDRGAWWTIVYRLTKSWTRLRWLSTHTHTYIITNNHKHSDLKQYKILFYFGDKNFKISFTGSTSSCWQTTVFPLEALDKNPFPSLSQLPEASCIPWLVVSSIFQPSCGWWSHSHNATSALGFLFLSSLFKDTCDYTGLTWITQDTFLKVNRLVTLIPSASLILPCHII